MSLTSDTCHLTIYRQEDLLKTPQGLWKIHRLPQNKGAEPLTIDSVFGVILLLGGMRSVFEKRLEFSYNPPLAEIEKQVYELFPKEPETVRSPHFGKVVIDPSECPIVARGIKVLMDLWEHREEHFATAEEEHTDFEQTRKMVYKAFRCWSFFCLGGTVIMIALIAELLRTL